MGWDRKDVTKKGLNELRKKLNNMGDVSVYTRAMNKACRVVETKAKQNCTGLFDNSTGILKASIMHEVVREGNEITGYVGSNMNYAPYQEFGTGKFAENGDGRTTPWAYTDEKTGETIWTAGNKPKPFLRPAFNDTRDKVKTILAQGIKAAARGEKE